MDIYIVSTTSHTPKPDLFFYNETQAFAYIKAECTYNRAMANNCGMMPIDNIYHLYHYNYIANECMHPDVIDKYGCKRTLDLTLAGVVTLPTPDGNGTLSRRETLQALGFNCLSYHKTEPNHGARMAYTTTVVW